MSLSPKMLVFTSTLLVSWPWPPQLAPADVSGEVELRGALCREGPFSCSIITTVSLGAGGEAQPEGRDRKMSEERSHVCIPGTSVHPGLQGRWGSRNGAHFRFLSFGFFSLRNFEGVELFY